VTIVIMDKRDNI